MELHTVKVAPSRGTVLVPYEKSVSNLIPHSKIVRLHNERHVEVPHGREEVQLLRNLGYTVPAPILHHYDWPGLQTPFTTQKKTAAMLTMQRRAFVLNQFGTGKTRATLFAADFLQRRGDINKILIIAPLSTLNPVWYSECFQLFNHLNPVVLHGTRARRLKLLNSDEFDTFIINHDGIGIIVEAMLERTDINCVILDELTAFRNARTDRFKFMRKIVQGRDFIWGLTGAPTPNEPTDAWAQCRLVNPDRVSRNFRDFRDETMLKVSQFKWVGRPNANDTVFNAMQPAVCYTRAESYTAKKPTYSPIEPELSKQQKKFYNAMRTNLAVQYKNHEITAANEGVKMGKLLQVCCGYVYDNDRNVLGLSPGPRLEAIDEVIQESDAKVIVFVPFIHAVQQVEAWLSKKYSTALIYGDIKKKARDQIFNSFQKADDPHVLVAHPKTMSHGLTLTAASTIVWYSPTTSLETYIQANARFLRESQKYVPAIVHVESTEVEKRLYKRLKNRQSTQGVLLEMFEEASL